MSTIYGGTIPCGGCGAEVAVQLADSLNANRMPAARDWVVERTLMTGGCGCGATTTAIQPVLYVDFERRLWIQAVEDDRRAVYPVCEDEVRAQFAAAFDTTRFPRFVGVWRDQLAPRVAAMTMPTINPASRTSRKTMTSAPSIFYSAMTVPFAVAS